MTPSGPLMERLKNIVGIGVLIAAPVAMFYEYKHFKTKEYNLETSSRYTVGEVVKTGYVISPSSHGYTEFVYQVGDSAYTGYEDTRTPAGQTLFLVRYSTQHPEYYDFYNRVPLLPTNIPPPEGWAEPPYPVLAKDLE